MEPVRRRTNKSHSLVFKNKFAGNEKKQVCQ